MQKIEDVLPFSEVPQYLRRTNADYRKHDPARFLYKNILDFDQEAKYGKTFYELVYVTLSAWNMNSRGAKLAEFDTFCESLECSRDLMLNLNEFELKDFDNNRVRELLNELFEKLKLVVDGNPPLVTFSKTLHFFSPNLVAPIDRKYTIKLFFGWTSFSWSRMKQFEVFVDIHREFQAYANKFDLVKFLDKEWNRSVPKIIDNAVIGSFLHS